MSTDSSTAQIAPIIRQADLVEFAEAKVNLRRDDVREHREQANRLRDKLKKFITEHPDYGLVKTLLSGSLAKGTALKTLNDIDLVDTRGRRVCGLAA